MTASENIIPNYYASIEEALDTVQKIRKASILVKENSGHWRALSVNNRLSLSNDMNSLNISDSEAYIIINDNFGKIERTNVQLSKDDILYFSQIISQYEPENSPLLEQLNNIPYRFRCLKLSPEQEEESGDDYYEAAGGEERSGQFELEPLEMTCYFDSFIPDGLVVEQVLGDDCYEALIIYITISEPQSLNILAPLFRKSQNDMSEAWDHVSANEPVRLKLALKSRLLERLKYQIFQIEDLYDVMEFINPLNKMPFTNLDNYQLLEISYQ